jgi:hypothetical protein
MGFGKKSSQPQPAAPVDNTPQVTSNQVEQGEDAGRPGTRRVARFRSIERDRDASLNDPGSETGGDDPMGGSRRPRASGRKSAAMLY